MKLLEIKNLAVQIEGKSILCGVNLTVEPSETVALMGQNGSGKSTLALTLAGHPSYQLTGGKIKLANKDITTAKPEERAGLGLFLSFQHPLTLPGVTVADFIRTAINSQRTARGESPITLRDYLIELRTNMKLLGIKQEFAQRSLGDGFSGGEKKKLEVLQALMLKPRLIVLDELDSGLDIDAIKTVSAGINLLQQQGAAVIAITHYQRILQYIKPTTVHIMAAGKIVKSGGFDLVEKLEQGSYASLTDES